jgi:hypothetical protein
MSSETVPFGLTVTERLTSTKPGWLSTSACSPSVTPSIRIGARPRN